MKILFFWACFSMMVGILAAKFNRSVIGWIALAVVISPIIAGLILLCLGEKQHEVLES